MIKRFLILLFTIPILISIIVEIIFHLCIFPVRYVVTGYGMPDTIHSIDLMFKLFDND